jgi:dihydroneopterin aldolase / 2-amino-4-hydroxy-6-hydroxymethyldihydropteridine diphosphokinase / dihydropteroate synthase
MDPDPHTDKIRINDLSLSVLLEGGASWPSSKAKLQPILVSLAITLDISNVAKTDDLSKSIDYSNFCSQVTKGVSGETFSTLEAVLDRIFHLGFQDRLDISELFVKVVQVKSPIPSRAIGIECSRRKGENLSTERYFIEGLVCQTIVGVNPCEREERQDVSINISVAIRQRILGGFEFRTLTRRISDVRQHILRMNLKVMNNSIPERRKHLLLHPGGFDIFHSQ